MALAFFMSGASGLLFELIWLHRCGLVFGNGEWATSIVLSSFMGGLALGHALVARYGHRVRRFYRAYAVAEIVVAVGGIVLTMGLVHLTTVLAPLTRAVGETTWLVNLIRLAAAFGVLALPATAMGTTLPLLAGALSGPASRFGAVVGKLYGWNTLGAVAGSLSAEVVLIPRYGLNGSALIAASLNVGAAAAALYLSRYGDGVRAMRTQRSSTVLAATPRAAPLMLCALIAGFALMAAEVVWFRLLSMLVVNTTLAASLMLACVLMAIGLGGLIGAYWIERRARADQYLPPVAVATACALIASYGLFPYLTPEARPWEWYRILWLAVCLTFPTSFLSGAMFTLIAGISKQATGGEALAAARLLLANTAGATAGPLAASFLLIPAMGMDRSLFALTLLYCLVAGLAWRSGSAALQRGTSWATRAAAIAALFAVIFPFGLLSGRYFPRVLRANTVDGSELIATREGTTETIFLTRQSWKGETIYHRLITNGFSMSGTAIPGKRYMRQFVYLPMLLHQGPVRRALVICYGVGVTVSAARSLPAVEAVDVVEISRDIVAMSDFIYSPEDHPLHDPRVRLHLEDGRYYLQTTSQHFDLITAEPPPPLTPATVNIYTREYFQLIFDRLSEGGITSYWLPVARQEGIDHAAIVRAFCDVFDDCSLWNGTPTDLMLMGTRHATAEVSSARFSEPWSDPIVGPSLRETGFEQPEQIGATFIGDAMFLRQLTASTPALEDNYPRRVRLTPSNAALPGRSTMDTGGTEYFRAILDPQRARSAFASSPFIRRLWPADLRSRTLPYFEVQRIINRVLVEGADPLAQIEDLQQVLISTSLRTLPYWLLGLGNHPILNHLDQVEDDGTGQTQYVRGVRALVGRDYSEAVRQFRQSQAKGVAGSRPLLVFALCLADRLEEARQDAQGAEAGNPSQRHFWSWMRTTYNVGP